ncbi:1-phosphatidylinositol phosphodiesterase [Coccidioides immitis RMSCC 3703]|uniref:1-phosphatidylinositol phosphodiesterase n=1 Tax=Coccidioides immitis RMSCC 3703 TaxID=454286 RepID=A0A0J8TRP2_COCIT|nr:1-phosphatidylinositol phosphodiesterase [Coccidioides immitis RMSCC 3703]
MVAEYLTIRNLTPNPIELKHVERFAPPDVPKPDIKNITKSFATLMNNITRSANEVDAIAHGSEAVSKEDVSVRVEPFTAVKTEIRAYKNSDKERSKLTVEVEGERHQVQTPVPTSDSATMKALKDNPRFRLTAIYITPESHLTIFSSANLNSWMKELKDETLLSALSIPGTHNSPTCHVAPPSVRCQAYFRDLVNEIEGFLQRNPSETLIMSVKREGPGKHTDAQLSKILHDHYARDPHKWYTEPKVPRLEVARGKIVLIRRFGLDDSLKKQWNGRGWGIDATGWADNTPHANCPSGHVCIQDFYEVLETENIDKKIEYVTAQLARSAALCYPLGGGDDEKDRSPFYVNFLSASNFWKVQTWPEKIAAKLNPATVDYICRKHSHDKDGDWSTGILVCDWVGLDGDWDLR